MSKPAYRLPDEPTPSGLAKYVVDPMWPLLAMMFAGNLFGMAWFVFNGAALGAQQRGREYALALLSIGGAIAIAFALQYGVAQGWLPGARLQYALLSLIALKMACGYALYLRQASTFEIWEHYGGRANNGLIGLVPMALFGGNVLRQLPPLLQAAMR